MLVVVKFCSMLKYRLLWMLYIVCGLEMQVKLLIVIWLLVIELMNIDGVGLVRIVMWVVQVFSRICCIVVILVFSGIENWIWMCFCVLFIVMLWMVLVISFELGMIRVDLLLIWILVECMLMCLMLFFWLFSLIQLLILIGCLVSRIRFEMKFWVIVCRLKLMFIDSVLIISVSFLNLMFSVVSFYSIVVMMLRQWVMVLMELCVLVFSLVFGRQVLVSQCWNVCMIVYIIRNISSVYIMLLGLSVVLLIFNLFDSVFSLLQNVLRLLNGIVSVRIVSRIMLICSIVESSMLVCFIWVLFSLVVSMMVCLIWLLGESIVVVRLLVNFSRSEVVSSIIVFQISCWVMNSVKLRQFSRVVMMVVVIIICLVMCVSMIQLFWCGMFLGLLLFFCVFSLVVVLVVWWWCNCVSDIRMVMISVMQVMVISLFIVMVVILLVCEVWLIFISRMLMKVSFVVFQVYLCRCYVVLLLSVSNCYEGCLGISRQVFSVVMKVVMKVVIWKCSVNCCRCGGIVLIDLSEVISIIVVNFGSSVFIVSSYIVSLEWCRWLFGVCLDVVQWWFSVCNYRCSGKNISSVSIKFVSGVFQLCWVMVLCVVVLFCWYSSIRWWMLVGIWVVNCCYSEGDSGELILCVSFLLNWVMCIFLMFVFSCLVLLVSRLVCVMVEVILVCCWVMVLCCWVMLCVLVVFLGILFSCVSCLFICLSCGLSVLCVVFVLCCIVSVWLDSVLRVFRVLLLFSDVWICLRFLLVCVSCVIGLGLVGLLFWVSVIGVMLSQISSSNYVSGCNRKEGKWEDKLVYYGFCVDYCVCVNYKFGVVQIGYVWFSILVGVFLFVVVDG